MEPVARQPAERRLRVFVDVVQRDDGSTGRAPRTAGTTNMRSTRFGRSVSACELSCNPGCLNMCGMCPSCVFAPRPPGSIQCVWKVSDGFRRRFVLELISRCRNTRLLQRIQSVLGVTSWSLFSYSRSRSPTCPPGHRCHSADTERCGGSPAGVDAKEIWDWFGSSPDWITSRYLCRVLSLCDPELLRMVTNLTSVLLVRQNRGSLQFNGKKQQHRSFSVSFSFGVKVFIYCPVLAFYCHTLF